VFTAVMLSVPQIPASATSLHSKKRHFYLLGPNDDKGVFKVRFVKPRSTYWYASFVRFLELTAHQLPSGAQRPNSGYIGQPEPHVHESGSVLSATFSNWHPEERGPGRYQPVLVCISVTFGNHASEFGAARVS
jgi:hypothetical protein